MDINFSTLDHAVSRFDICRGDRFFFEEDILILTEEGYSISPILTSDMTDCGYDPEATAFYFVSLAEKLELAVQEALKGDSNIQECKALRNRATNLCWMMHDFVSTCKKIDDGKLFKELEIRFWKQKVELASVDGCVDTRFLHPDIQKLLINEDIYKAIYIKKYPFSDDTLNVQALGIMIITGKSSNIPVSSQTLLMLLEHHSELGEEVAQERLYDFLERPIGKIDFVDLNKASILLESTLRQEKMWALKSKIQKMLKDDQNTPFSIVPLYITAAHKGDLESIKKLMEILGEKITFTLPDNEKMILKNYSLYKYKNEGFGTTPWNYPERPWLSYGVPLTSIGHKLYSMGSSSNAMLYFKEAASLGDVNAMVVIGAISTQQGNLLEALYWNRLAAEKGNVEVMSSLGGLEQLAFNGHMPNLQKALKWSTIAANGGSINGSYLAGQCEEREFEGHIANPKRALDFYTYSAEKGHIGSMHSFGVLELKTNPLTALYWWTKAASLGDIKSMAFLGALEGNGFPGHPPDRKKALYWLTKASDAKDFEAMAVLGMLEIEEFDSHPADPAKGLKLSLEAAEGGHVGAMNNVGLLEERNFKNHKPCLSNALYWYRKSAGHGCSLAMRNLVRLTLTTNKKEALKWSSIGGHAGDLELMVHAGQLEAETFDGHPCNLAKSLEWYLKVGELGSTIGMYNAGILETKAFDGHLPNPAKALKLYSKAAKSGMSDAMLRAGLLEMEEFQGHASNMQKAIELIVGAAQAENADAMGLMAMLLLANKDKLDEKLIGQALFWLRKAHAAGSGYAKSILDTISEASSKKDEEILAILNHRSALQSSFILSVPMGGPEISSTSEKEVLVSHQIEKDVVKEGEESDDSTDELERELLSYPDLSQYKSTETDASNIRAQFAKLNEINNKLEKNQVILGDLSQKNQLIWESLKDPSGPCITIAELIHFAEDKSFVGKFVYSPTTSGIMFCLANKFNGVEKFGTVSTHRKHKKSYKGANKQFLENFRQTVMTVFGFE